MFDNNNDNDKNIDADADNYSNDDDDGDDGDDCVMSIHSIDKTEVVDQPHVARCLLYVVDRGCYEELVELATCPSCRKITTDMKILPCMDHCCISCLQQHVYAQHSCNEMNCPSCDHSFLIPQQGLEQLPSNTYVRAVVPAQGDAEKPVCLPFGDVGQILRCGGCSRKTAATKLNYCKECRQCLCGQCVGVHRNLRSTRNHHVVDRSQSLPSMDCDSLACFRHPSKTNEAFCSDCASLCCVACLQKVHQDHDWCDVDEISQKFRRQLDDDVETARRAASRCEDELQRLDDAEKMLSEHVLAVKNETNSQRDDLIDAINDEVAQLHDELEQAHDVTSRRLHQNEDRIRKQKHILQCFEKFCQNVVETGTVHEVIHVYNSVHVTDEVLPLQQVSSNADIPHLRFTPVNVRDFLPHEAQHLVGSLSDAASTIQHATWNQLRSQLQETLEQLCELQQQANNNQNSMTCLEKQLAEKTELLEEVRKERDEKVSLVDELGRQMSDMASDVEAKESVVNSLTEELQQRDGVIDEYTKQAQALYRQVTETEQDCQSRLREYELKLEKTALDLQESERSADEYRAAGDQLNVRVQQLEETLSCTMSKEDQMTTQLEDAWQQITEQSMIIEHVPPAAGQSSMILSQSLLYNRAAVGIREFNFYDFFSFLNLHFYRVQYRPIVLKIKIRIYYIITSNNYDVLSLSLCLDLHPSSLLNKAGMVFLLYVCLFLRAKTVKL